MAGLGARTGREEAELVDIEVSGALTKCEGGLSSEVGEFAK